MSTRVRITQRPHAMSRYTAVTEAVIEKCQQDYRAGRELGRSIPDLSATNAAIIVSESLEADPLLEALPEVILRQVYEPLSDWSLAVLAEIVFSLADQLPKAMNFPEVRRQELLTMAWEAMERVLDSPTASPLLWYEGIYFDVAQEYRLDDDRRAIELLKRGLAHNLRYDEGSNAENFLRDLAETHLWLDELDRGLEILTGLLRRNPADIWTYNLIAFIFDRSGLVELGLAGTRRGLELIEATGDSEGLRQQLNEALEDLQRSEKRERETEANPEVVADFRQALALDFEAGQRGPLAELCRTLVPDLDRVPVKRPREKPDLPSPDVPDQRQRFRPGGRKLGRNDLCWCGSGKKYKHCHMRSDRGR
jgi:tetratricopeptide (TPR) repeat protein